MILSKFLGTYLSLANNIILVIANFGITYAPVRINRFPVVTTEVIPLTS